jgi:hypothetical protein
VPKKTKTVSAIGSIPILVTHFAGDPPVRPDGLCARPLCGKELPRIAVRSLDPFCTTGCCKTFYGVAAGRPDAQAAPAA